MAGQADSARTGRSLSELVEELVSRGEADGRRCVDLSELSEVLQESQLDDDDLQVVQVSELAESGELEGVLPAA